VCLYCARLYGIFDLLCVVLPGVDRAVYQNMVGVLVWIYV
jgi:uncharacterized protein YjaG (DUF416 family)